MVTLKQAKFLTDRDWLVDKRGKRWRVTSVKTWKRNPRRVRLGLKHGLYTYDKIDEYDLDNYRVEGGTRSINTRVKRNIKVGDRVRLKKGQTTNLGKITWLEKGEVRKYWGKDRVIVRYGNNPNSQFAVPIKNLRKLPTRNKKR